MSYKADCMYTVQQTLVMKLGIFMTYFPINDHQNLDKITGKGSSSLMRRVSLSDIKVGISAC